MTAQGHEQLAGVRYVYAGPDTSNEVLARSIAWGAGAGALLGEGVVAISMLGQLPSWSRLVQAVGAFLLLGPFGAFFGALIGTVEGLAAGVVLAIGRNWIGASGPRAAGLGAIGATIVPLLICLCARSYPITLGCLVFSLAAAAIWALLAPYVVTPSRTGRLSARTC